ncbi:MAG: XdhC family protein [Chloroflexi bacterium]|nr:XdhC family protein [Chloroflexota bacterium]
MNNYLWPKPYSGHFLIPKQLMQQIIVMLRCSTPVAPVSNGEVLDLMGNIAAVLKQQGAGETLDAEALEAALEMMPKGQERWVETKEGDKAYVETFTNPPTVVIAGGGHVGKAVYTVANTLGFAVKIVDDRPQFANEERFPDADEIVIDDFDKGLRGLNLTPNCYVIVATRGHKLDDVALAEAARSNAGYVGLLGSRRKAVMIFRDLLRQGISEERMRQIHAPVGLDLGGRTPDEIAVSIVAEIVAIKHGRHGGSMTLDQKFLDKAKQLASRPKPRQKVQAAL